MPSTYRNPILRGFFPDPSLIRVGEDYYLANSTFEYFPAVVISHSRDLVHWKIVGHAINRNDFIDLTEIDDSHGFWAPDISCHNGTYYIFVTLRLNGNPTAGHKGMFRRQVVVKADKPEGPYSRPVFIDVDGIDPSHFVDDDGRHFMLLTPGATIVPLNDDCSASTGEPRTIWPGTGLRCPEGPHLLKKDGWYYCILAEGGTGYGHQVSVGRSRQLYGPYTASPYNPVMTQTDPAAPIQRAGHGKLVQTHKGDWWMVYLCGRPNGGNFTTLGRETALDPVEWTEDGWFTVNGGRGPSLEQRLPDLPAAPVPQFRKDDFDGEQLDLHWQFLRNPDDTLWSLTTRPGHLRLITSNAPPGSLQARNIILRREEHFRYSATTKVEFAPTCPRQEAGLIAYHGMHCFIALCVTREEKRCARAVASINRELKTLGNCTLPASGPLYLKMTVSGQKRKFFFSQDGQEWHCVGVAEDASFLSNEGVTIGKHHTGTLVGLYATSGETGERLPADFDWFAYQPEA